MYYNTGVKVFSGKRTNISTEPRMYFHVESCFTCRVFGNLRVEILPGAAYTVLRKLVHPPSTSPLCIRHTKSAPPRWCRQLKPAPNTERFWQSYPVISAVSFGGSRERYTIEKP